MNGANLISSYLLFDQSRIVGSLQRVSRVAGLVQCRCYDFSCSVLQWGIRLTGDTRFGFDTMSALRVIASLVLIALAWWSNRMPAPSDSNG